MRRKSQEKREKKPNARDVKRQAMPEAMSNNGDVKRLFA
jgi:hypothetical protein